MRAFAGQMRSGEGGWWVELLLRLHLLVQLCFELNALIMKGKQACSHALPPRACLDHQNTTSQVTGSIQNGQSTFN